MAQTDIKHNIESALQHFGKGDLLANATSLLNILGYSSDKVISLSPSTAEEFERIFPCDAFRPDKALTDDWEAVEMIFQLTNDEIDLSQNQQVGLFADDKIYQDSNIKSFVFLALQLKNESYSRTQLATITREINRVFAMPAIVLFQHGKTLTFSVVDRRINKRDSNKDVLEKVTLIKDIRLENPHRAHLEILSELALAHLKSTFTVHNFDQLYDAWSKTLSVSELNKRFYQELSNWYFWALQEVNFPMRAGVEDRENRATNVIRLITRLIFAWFMKEKGLLPEVLFNQEKLFREILYEMNPDESTFYQAILQNLFFATLNTEMDNPKLPRKFRIKSTKGRDQNRMAHTLYRHEDLFRDSAQALKIFENIPFLNGGLFECLDKEVEQDGEKVVVRIDGFSDNPRETSTIPNRLFFSESHDVDINEELGTKNKTYKARGLLDIFHSYKFTVDENTPIEEEIALDPELLGKVFENLLASYNPETGVAARKQTGSFYTPREIVGYMVDESMLAYFQSYLESQKIVSDESADPIKQRLSELLGYQETIPLFNSVENAALVQACSEVKILDPACGSGAFPMGILHKLVFVLGKLDPRNIGWKQQQLQRAERDLARADKMEDEDIRGKAVEEASNRILEIKESFDNPNHEIDYLRKLYLIEHCIYGVDIQYIAIQISKLRFFISLVIEQKLNSDAPNLGVRPLPNLETKFVAANTLLSIEKPQQVTLRNADIDAKEAELKVVRERYFLARTPKTKEKYREEDKRLRGELGQLLLVDRFLPETTQMLASWDPYDQNTSAEFFDAEWMFGVVDGFDIVIGNPPYIRVQNLAYDLIDKYKETWTTAWKRIDISTLFMEFAISVCAPKGIAVYISSNQFLVTEYGRKTREYFLKSAGIAKIVDLGDLPVFDNTLTYVSIFFLVSKTSRSFEYAKVLTLPFKPSKLTWEEISSAKLSGDSWVLGANADISLVARLSSANQRLDSFAKCWAGVITGLDRVLMFDDKDNQIESFENEILMPVLRAQSCERYCFAKTSKTIIYPYVENNQKTVLLSETQLRNQFPQTYKYLTKHRIALSERRDSRKTLAEKGVWYGLVRFGKRSVFTREKIVSPGEVRHNKFALDVTGAAFSCARVFAITSESDNFPLRYLLGLLNSKLIEFYLHKTAPIKQGGYYSYTANVLNALPIPTSTPAQQKVLSDKVDEILTAKAANSTADTSALEREIDILVADLYGLDDAERKLVGIEN